MNREALSKAVCALTELMNTLRDPGGCPWDARQTEETIKMYLLEEAYEVLEAVESGDWEEVCGELGDLLFQIIFMARIAEEKGAFDLLRVVRDITNKMIARHPHVFGQASVGSVREVRENWAKIKQEEKGEGSPFSSQLRGIPANLPALLQTHRLTERAAGVGWREPKGRALWQEMTQRFEELESSLSEEVGAQVEESLGALLFDLAMLARQQGRNAENLLRKKNREFLRELKKREKENSGP